MQQGFTAHSEKRYQNNTPGGTTWGGALTAIDGSMRMTGKSVSLWKGGTLCSHSTPTVQSIIWRFIGGSLAKLSCTIPQDTAHHHTENIYC